MTSAQLAEWELMYRRWHMGDSPHERDDLSAAIVAQTVANVHVKKPMKLDAFMPAFGEPTTPSAHSADAFRDRMLAYANRSKRRKRGDDKQAPG